MEIWKVFTKFERKRKQVEGLPERILETKQEGMWKVVGKCKKSGLMNDNETVGGEFILSFMTFLQLHDT